MHTDLLGSPVAFQTAEARAAWDGMVLGFLSHGQSTPDHLARLLAAAPDAALPWAVKGLFCVLLGRREMTDTAWDALRTAEDARAHASADLRTDALIAALRAMLARQPLMAVTEIERILRADPGDTLAMKLSHAIRFLVGDATGMRRSVERVLDAHGSDHPGRGYALGCHAFALEETGAYTAAERAGHAALTHAGDDAWGLHAIAHVHDMTGRPEDGIAVIEAHDGAWLHCNNFRYHVWWHKALLHLDRGESDIVLALYDRKIRADKTDDYRDIANATSLLQRLELDGVDVGDRWDELADLAEGRVTDGALVFADLHYMLALMGGDRRAARDRLTARLALQAVADDGLAPIAAHPGIAAAAGLAAFGEGHYDTAFQHLDHACAGLQSIGGSHAQRDVFERMAVEAGLRAGRLDRTERLLRARTSRRAGTPDRFAETRLERVAAARKLAVSVPAQ